MNRLAVATRTWLHEILAGWDRFWFTPADPATLGVIRICTGAMLLYTHLVWSLDLAAFFGPEGWLSADAVGQFQQNSYYWSYFWWISDVRVLWAVHIAALIVFVMLTLGLYSRVVSVLAFIATLSYMGRVPGALFGLDRTNVMLAMYLMVGNCGAAYSLDRWLKRRRAGHNLPVEKSVGVNIAIRLIQLHMCVIYLFAGTAKLMGPAWWDGTAMWLAIANLEYQSLDVTWMVDWPRLVNLMTHLTIFWEIYYCALVWPRLTRPIVLLLAIPLHLGIAICLGMVTFGLIMLVGNLAFVAPRLVRMVIDRGRAGESNEVDSPASLAGPTGGDRSRRPGQAVVAAKRKR